MTDSRGAPVAPRSGRLTEKHSLSHPRMHPTGRRIRIFTRDSAIFPEEAEEGARPADPFVRDGALRQIHSARPAALEDLSTGEAVCSSCREDLGAPDLNYRLVLRCSSPAGGKFQG